MKFGPLTFQWACLTCVCRSLQSASRALSSSIALMRLASGRSFLVLNMARPLFHVRLAGMAGAGGLVALLRTPATNRLRPPANHASAVGFVSSVALPLFLPYCLGIFDRDQGTAVRLTRRKRALIATTTVEAAISTAPSSARCFAMEAPIPLDAPVTTA